MESANTIVHSVVTVWELSPIKKSKEDKNLKFFCGQLSDSKKCMVSYLSWTNFEACYVWRISKKDSI